MEMCLAAMNGTWIPSQSFQRWKNWHLFPCGRSSHGCCSILLTILAMVPLTTVTLFAPALWKTKANSHDLQTVWDDIKPVKLCIDLWHLKIKRTLLFIVILSLNVHLSTCRNQSRSTIHAWELPSSCSPPELLGVKCLPQEHLRHCG